MKKIVRWVAVFAFPIVLQTGCVTPGVTAVSTQDFVHEMPDPSASKSELVVGNTVELSVEVDGNMEVLSHRAQINQQGMVTLPLVGDVKIDGCTLSKARTVITQTYGAYYVNPPVVMLALQVDPGDGEWGSVTVMGRVVRPGRVPLRSQHGMNLTEVIQEAGGLAPSANKNKIRVSRIDSEGNKLKVSVDFEGIGEKGNTEADIKLIDGDIVYVPERMF